MHADGKPEGRMCMSGWSYSVFQGWSPLGTPEDANYGVIRVSDPGAIDPDPT